MPAENSYSVMAQALRTALLADLTVPPYSWPLANGADTGLLISLRVFKEGNLPPFTRYSIIVSPSPNPWDESRLGVPQIEYLHRADLFILVKNFDEEESLFGTVHPNRGLFQLVSDVKQVLRISSLGGLITLGNKTYDEPAGPLSFQSFTGGFDVGEKAFVQRVKLQFVGRMAPFCHPRNL
jgi:hypothetical protein